MLPDASSGPVRVSEYLEGRLGVCTNISISPRLDNIMSTSGELELEDSEAYTRPVRWNRRKAAVSETQP